jgi:hypothetical protein
MEQLGTYSIETYNVEVDTLENNEIQDAESRQMIIYYDLYDREITRERYYGYANNQYQPKNNA